MEKDPRRLRLSDNFVLSDFLGNHTVYSQGVKNPFVFDKFSTKKLDNVKALCLHGLEPIMAEFGPLSVSYGYISPELSRKIVKYQDPDKPSHHRFDLGAAADICVHRWVAGRFPTIFDMYCPVSAVGSPIALAFALDYMNIPYSRMITYSESPFLCLAISADEVERQRPREAFYENRYTGVRKAKPDYRQYSTQFAKSKAFEELQTSGLGHDWRGDGYPTYHGGGRRQYQHTRVSKYTMVSDWLFDLKSISEGEKNIPALNNEAVQDAFAAAGIVYDWIVNALGVPRIPIVAGYVSPSNRFFDEANDWRGDTIYFALNPPELFDLHSTVRSLETHSPEGAIFSVEDGFIVVRVNVSTVLESVSWE